MEGKANVVSGIVGLVVAGVAAVWIIYTLLRPETPGEKYDRIIAAQLASDAERAETKARAQERNEAAARAAVLSTLRDPASALFSGVRPGRDAADATICGLVNAKNGFGGYAGARRFIASQGKLVIDGANTPFEVDSAWQKSCS
jgi:hypothetical protein